MSKNQKQALLSAFWIILGIVLLFLTFTEIIDSTLYGGMGGALIAVGCLQLFRHIRYDKDENYRERIDIEVSDERNQFLRLRSWSWAGYITVLLEAIASVIAFICKQVVVGQVLSYSICLIVFIYWLSYVILSKKY